ncbi:hypothetical protein TNIN_213541 [Trichonephila inaurata madagascariensis]|uniref:Uncharacterized protein n=1 Tax=Trichonephila inaurata madagascariensis TaxID=2747483 RepID=A0A8X6X1J7_9ARAC|nr:hypothetical protein TNIN_213541 [Trichonephila inaurata madagascariensis]
MAGNLSEEHRLWILKTYWKYENAETVRRILENQFHLLIRLMIYRIRDKFVTASSVSNATKSGDHADVDTGKGDEGSPYIIKQSKEVHAIRVPGAGYPEDIITMSDAPAAP